MLVQNFVKTYETGFRKNWELPALSDFSTKERLYYKDLAREIARVHILLKEAGITQGDKVALVGKNNIPWCVVYLATFTYGAVIIPILQDFHPDNIQYIINHSDAKLLFAEESLFKQFNTEAIPQVKAALSTDTLDFACLYDKDNSLSAVVSSLEERMQTLYPEGYRKEDIRYAYVHNSEVVLINYTSGTMGASKGVMLTANNLTGNIGYAHHLELLFPGQDIISFLPLAHAYGAAFEFLFALSEGCHVTLLGKKPSPQLLLQAFTEIKPTLIVCVPLIIEKIYKKAIQPKLEQSSIRLALKLPIIRNLVYKKMRDGLIEALGGNFYEVIIGGAALNQEVEAFFHKIKFPFTVGYGMTECGPLISYDHYFDFVPASCGHVLDNIMEVRIDSEDPYNIVGEIQVRGENVMKGYYKNEEATQAAFTHDGWLRTGDLGTIDEKKHIFIRGRSKAMLLGPSGQNIYPEEIETKLSNMPYVAECLVVQRDKKLIALVHPDYEQLDSDKVKHAKLSEIMKKNLTQLNNRLANYEKVAAIEIVSEEFEKTPKRSIKRYLYES
ncbi:AMP-binding protein [Dysgonomonas sp. 25]|uniref:AMP-binding protein n=1 Tax=Dysgonomonas sp. 25 TaxID=2302933 RepID=UPI0013D3F2E9|nr:AMP-binding protein [Dysgonomonas sp. 25]NDV69045.1 long-chain fatty acid--CoA ligase [Dysgonomonas sp. 25]